MFTEVLTVLSGVFTFYADVKTFLEFRRKYNNEQWQAEVSVLTKAIKGATTDDQRRELVRRLSGHDDSTP